MEEPQPAKKIDPCHVAIVMDGNGRWAQSKGLPRHEGHLAGVENVRRIVEAARELDIRYLTLFAFSSENWNRPQEEIQLLMELLQNFIDKQGEELVRNEIRFHVVGDSGRLPDSVREALRRLVGRTSSFTRHTLSLALNYGSRQEIVHAVRSLLEEQAQSSKPPEALDYGDLARHFYTGGLPDPDLVIRTSGEYRLSNFLLLQSAYSEFYFSPKCWPEFGPPELEEAVVAYRQRERRFGKVREQIKGTLAGSLSTL